jgi:hypothetical protein
MGKPHGFETVGEASSEASTGSGTGTEFKAVGNGGAEWAPTCDWTLRRESNEGMAEQGVE